MADFEYEKKIALAIFKRFEEKGEPESAQDGVYLLRQINNDWAHKQSEKLRELIVKHMREHTLNERLFKVLRESLKFDATVNFDAFMRFMEWERDPKQRYD